MCLMVGVSVPPEGGIMHQCSVGTKALAVASVLWWAIDAVKLTASLQTLLQ